MVCRCQFCHCEFESVGRGRPSRFCSLACRKEFRGTPRECEICGVEYYSRRNQGITCSQKCAAQLRLTKKAQWVVHISGTCEGCGVDFARGVAGADHKKGIPSLTYCSVECYRAHDSRNRQHRRRAALGGAVTADEVMVQQLLERDGPYCRLCGGDLDITKRGRSSESVSVDHIVPIASGGKHSLKNCQLAHLGCNSRKCNKSCERIPDAYFNRHQKVLFRAVVN